MGREVGEKGEGSGGKGGGNREWGTPLSTPSTRSRGDISSINYVELVDKNTKTEQGLRTVMLSSLPKLRPGIHL